MKEMIALTCRKNHEMVMTQDVYANLRKQLEKGAYAMTVCTHKGCNARVHHEKLVNVDEPEHDLVKLLAIKDRLRAEIAKQKAAAEACQDMAKERKDAKFYQAADVFRHEAIRLEFILGE